MLREVNSYTRDCLFYCEICDSSELYAVLGEHEFQTGWICGECGKISMTSTKEWIAYIKDPRVRAKEDDSCKRMKMYLDATPLWEKESAQTKDD